MTTGAWIRPWPDRERPEGNAGGAVAGTRGARGGKRAPGAPPVRPECRPPGPLPVRQGRAFPPPPLLVRQRRCPSTCTAARPPGPLPGRPGARPSARTAARQPGPLPVRLRGAARHASGWARLAVHAGTPCCAPRSCLRLLKIPGANGAGRARCARRSALIERGSRGGAARAGLARSQAVTAALHGPYGNRGGPEARGARSTPQPGRSSRPGCPLHSAAEAALPSGAQWRHGGTHTPPVRGGRGGARAHGRPAERLGNHRDHPGRTAFTHCPGRATAHSPPASEQADQTPTVPNGRRTALGRRTPANEASRHSGAGHAPRTCCPRARITGP
ncbi:Hypothetical Protein sle_55700 [Streptomyces leeuwenhoekii]|uniref:Uncharacterized protein n=1 Tax=Streptomyces leeuwenhoekii TaxID=1437453 RepID=A0A0F7W577_STRLW|nr:Hypothetical Protein sle_55700 [Streptomyces leeuwenhoekii]